MRKLSRSPNMQVYWRANQFPSSRFSIDALGNKPVQQDIEDETPIPDDEREKLQYLKDRFKSTHTSGVDGPEGPCGKQSGGLFIDPTPCGKG